MNKRLTKSWQTLSAYLIGSRHSGDGSAFEARLRRLLIWLPLVGIALLLAWTHLVRQPRMDSLREKNQDLIVLEEAIKDYRLRLSDQQFSDLQVRQRDAGLFILPDEPATGRLLVQILAGAAAAGWMPVAEPAPASINPLPALPELALGTLNLQLTYHGQDAAPITSLLDWLDQLSGLDKRVDVSALDITRTGTEPEEVRLRLQFIQRASP